jgi:DNA-binding transcriptional regulator YdaS (Cro superfamily)
MSQKALSRALAAYEGNQSRFAAAIGTSQQLVSYWIRNGKVLPAEHVLKTEEATGISRHELRPDLYPREQANAA